MISEVIEQQEIKITKQRAEIERHAGEVKALHETIGVIDRQHAAEIRRLQTPRFDVVQLQPDDDCPGLWIGFQTAADREEAMKLFRCVQVRHIEGCAAIDCEPPHECDCGAVQSPPAVICPFCKQRVSETCCNEQNHKDCICWIEVQPLSVDPKDVQSVESHGETSKALEAAANRLSWCSAAFPSVDAIARERCGASVREWAEQAYAALRSDHEGIADPKSWDADAEWRRMTDIVCPQCKVRVVNRYGVCPNCNHEFAAHSQQTGQHMSEDGFAPGARPLCVFCGTPWDDDMIRVFDIDACHGEGSYDFGPQNQTATVDITCSTCSRLIYRKEYDGNSPRRR